MKKAVIIINPSAGHEKSGEYRNQLMEKFENHFTETVVRETEKEGDATEFAKEACLEKVDTLFVIGGDGTVNETLQGMAAQEFRPNFGVIPGGTFNALARAIGIPMKIEDAIESIDFNKIGPLDIGKINDRYFSYVVSLGDVPDAIHHVESEEKTRLGILAYFINIAGELKHNSNYILDITVDDYNIRTEVSHLVVVLSDNLGDFKFADVDASLSDGYAHVFILKDSSVLAKASMLLDIMTGKAEENDQIIYRRGRHIEIKPTAEEQIMTDIDGEEGISLPVSIDILPSHLNVYSPVSEEVDK